VNAEIAKLVVWYQGELHAGGYPLIAAMMAGESSVFPFPSEVVIPFAAQDACATGSHTILGVILAGVIGTWVGASAMYWVCRWGGRPLFAALWAVCPHYRGQGACRRTLGREVWRIRRPSSPACFRFLRQLIGIPMGIVKMDYRLYSLFTVLGSALWCSVLAWVGVAAGNDKELLQGNLHHILYWLLGLILALAGAYYFMVHRFIRKSSHHENGSSQT
jgi:membrane protein DedA with SNARE-associated domain